MKSENGIERTLSTNYFKRIKLMTPVFGEVMFIVLP